MKSSELRSILRQVLKEELEKVVKENYPIHPDDAADMGGDGYNNEYQRAFAHSQSTQPRSEGDGKKAKELAKQGKFVVTTEDDVHCKTTDAVMGSCISINSVHNTYEEAEKAATELDKYADRVNIVTPDSVNNKKSEPISTTVDDVPFEGYGAGDMSKYPKKAKPNSRWTVKYNENISLKEMKEMIHQLIKEEQSNTNDAQTHKSISKFGVISLEVVDQMREWALDCQWREDADEISEMSADEIIRGVNANYDGGVKEFIRDCSPVSQVTENKRPLYETKGKTRKEKILSMVRDVIKSKR